MRKKDKGSTGPGNIGLIHFNSGLLKPAELVFVLADDPASPPLSLDNDTIPSDLFLYMFKYKLFIIWLG